jgi:hypothetical protein
MVVSGVMGLISFLSHAWEDGRFASDAYPSILLDRVVPGAC